MFDASAPAAEIEEINRRLEDLAREKPELYEAVAFYRQILPVLKSAQERVLPFHLDKQKAVEKLEAGIPLLLGEELPFSQPAELGLLLEICRAVKDLPVEIGHGSIRSRVDEIRKIEDACEKGQVLLQPVFSAVLGGDSKRLHAAAQDLGLELPLFSLLVQNCLKPSLAAWAGGLSAGLDLSGWKRGRCPFCGDSPVFAELQGLQRACRLRCGRCGADWPFSRMQCAFCETRDYRVLGLIRFDERPENRWIQTCAACKSYLKMIITFEPTRADFLPIEDLATLSLDLAAGHHGYARPVRDNALERLSVG